VRADPTISSRASQTLARARLCFIGKQGAVKARRAASRLENGVVWRRDGRREDTDNAPVAITPPILPRLNNTY
jgi:hypothetical protein